MMEKEGQSQDCCEVSEIDLVGHCAFCQRLLLENGHGKDEDDNDNPTGFNEGDDRGALKIVPNAVIKEHHPLLRSFSHIWDYLLVETSKELEGFRLNYRFLNGSKHVGPFRDYQDQPRGQDIPPMCLQCWGLIQELDKLHRELMLKVESIRRIVVESSKDDGVHSWSGDDELRKKLEGAALKSSVKESTIQFLGQLLKSCTSTRERALQAPLVTYNPNQEMVFVLPSESDSESECTVKEEVISPPLSPEYDSGKDADEEMNETTELQDDIIDNHGYTSEAESTGSSYEKETRTDKSSSSASEEGRRSSSDSDAEYSPRKRSQKRPSPRTRNFKKTIRIRKRKKTQEKKVEVKEDKLPRIPVKKFRCDPCNKTVMSDKALILHQIKAHGADPAPHLKCKFCDRVCASWLTLENHERTHSDARKFKCDKEGCDKSFKTSINLLHHKQRVHKLGRPVCKTCGKSFYCRKTLKNHMTSVHLGIKHICNICGVGLSTAYGLRGHLRTHTGEKPFSCSICTRTFCTKTELNQHKRRCKAVPVGVEHSGVRAPREYKCNFKDCQERFPKMHDLLKHKNTHTDLQKFICEICGKGLASPQSLRIHHQATHLGLKKFICEVCGEGYSGKGYLRDHMLIHTLERPHSCDVCGQKFRTKCTLYAHLRRHEKKGDKFRPQGPMSHFRGRAC